MQSEHMENEIKKVYQKYKVSDDMNQMLKLKLKLERDKNLELLNAQKKDLA